MNHGLLDFTKRPVWKYIKNGSTTYIDYIIKHTKPNIKLKTHIKGIHPHDSKVKILTSDDEIFFAPNMEFHARNSSSGPVLGVGGELSEPPVVVDENAVAFPKNK